MDFQDCVDISLDDVVPLFSPGFSTVQSILGGVGLGWVKATRPPCPAAVSPPSPRGRRAGSTPCETRELSYGHDPFLVGGSEHGFDFFIYWEFHHPNRRTPSFFRGVGQPPTRFSWMIYWFTYEQRWFSKAWPQKFYALKTSCITGWT